MPKIIIQDFFNVIIADVNQNDIFAAIRSNPELATEIEAEAYHWAIGAVSAQKDNAEISRKLHESQAEFAAYKEAASQAAVAIKAVITDATKDDAVTVATIEQIVTYGEQEANKTAREREIATLDAEIAAAQAKRKALTQ